MCLLLIKVKVRVGIVRTFIKYRIAWHFMTLIVVYKVIPAASKICLVIYKPLTISIPNMKNLHLNP